MRLSLGLLLTVLAVSSPSRLDPTQSLRQDRIFLTDVEQKSEERAKDTGHTWIVRGLPTDADPPEGLSVEDWSRIENSIRNSAYNAAAIGESGEAPSYKASNPEQGYGTTFRRDGIEIAARNSSAGAWRLGVHVTGYGYEGDVRALPKALAPKADKRRVKYERGPVTEWYMNRSTGLEQGFELEKPEGRGGDNVVIEMKVDGDWKLFADGKDVSFSVASGEKILRYGDLKAWDADGRRLSSRLEAAENRIRLVVVANAARFPLTVDPTFIQETMLSASDATSWDYFGRTVAISGDTIVVGSINSPVYSDGAAYVFVRSGGSWSEQQILVPRSGAANFGHSVAIFGDTIVVGSGDRSVYVFVRSGSVWSYQQELTSPDVESGDGFSNSISISGDTVVVGAPYDDTTAGDDAGSAYVFVRAGSVWSQQQKLEATDKAAGDFFGYSVSIAGNYVVAGAPKDDTTAGEDAGSAYVFVRAGSVWSQQQKLEATDKAAGDQFGYLVAAFKGTVVAVAPEDEATFYQGSAYVFTYSSGVWSQQQKLTAFDVSSHFGYSLSIYEGKIVVSGVSPGLHYWERKTYTYVFELSGGSWIEKQRLMYGDSISISGGTIVIGHPYYECYDPTIFWCAGSAFVFREVKPFDFDADGVPDIFWRDPATGQNAIWYMQNNGRSLKHGAWAPTATTNWTVGGIADFDADGVPDVFWHDPATGQNAIWFMQNNGTSLKSAAWAPTAATNWTVGGIADFDADGVPDVFWHDPATGQNALWYMQNNGKSLKSAAWAPTAATNWTVGGIADFDADGVPDIFWHDPATGQNAIWYLQNNGTSLKSAAWAPTVTTNWTVGKVVDYDANGVPDILWHDPATGQNAIWYMTNNGKSLAFGAWAPTAAKNWIIGG